MCEENNAFVDEQNGFRKSRSCTEHLLSLTSCIDYKLKKGEPAFVCFADMINRDLLYLRLLEYDIGGDILSSTESLYDGSSATIRLITLMSSKLALESNKEIHYPLHYLGYLLMTWPIK